MKDLIAQLVSKVGISPEQAEGSIATVLEFLKDKLPGPIASQLDNLVGGEGGEGSNPLDKAKDVLGGFFGSKE